MVMYFTHIKVKVVLIFFFFFTEILSQEIFTIEIDGSNLPDDSGTITEGQKIFLENCKGCHGFSGEGLYGPELVGRSSLSGENISKTLGNYWPYAPKIFDYIKRAKRKENDSYFSNSEVYSLTGYLLKLNNLFKEEVINKKNLSNIKMPNRNGFISDFY